jgi:hypothetical protein
MGNGHAAQAHVRSTDTGRIVRFGIAHFAPEEDPRWAVMCQKRALRASLVKSRSLASSRHQCDAATQRDGGRVSA